MRPDDPPQPPALPPGLYAIAAAVETTLDAVSGPKGWRRVKARDDNDSFLMAAHGRAFRCMRAIYHLASPPECNADESATLTRSLVSIVARSLWLAAPDDDGERRVRLDRWRLRWVMEEKKTFDDQRALGFEVDEEYAQSVERSRFRLLDRGVHPMPDDRALLVSLDLAPVYARVFRPTSSAAHFSLGSALDGFIKPISPGSLTGRQASLSQTDPVGAEDVLATAAVTYGAFLSRSEAVIGHGAAPVALEQMQAYIAEHGRNASVSDNSAS